MIRKLLLLLVAFTLVGVYSPATSFAQTEKEAASPAADTPKVERELTSPQQPAPPEEEATSPKFSKWTALVASLTIFVLAVFVGFEIITKVPPTLHTPLMSGSNAISGIAIVGALLATALGANWFASLLGFLAIIMATVNVVGGYMVTNRMLSMFKAKR
ncbi:NAD(P) transhydrogenase subunit alpha [Bremerella cremea]|uniref:NAD(P) transhydrogenase subunit alpha n=1 Tax=Bremerella cremea TaxID=1031537 RepID=UPI001F3EEC4C|nr:NAD(P) transhydrogenase subunit alpha [Bremerella cremea]